MRRGRILITEGAGASGVPLQGTGMRGWGSATPGPSEDGVLEGADESRRSNFVECRVIVLRERGPTAGPAPPPPPAPPTPPTPPAQPAPPRPATTTTKTTTHHHHHHQHNTISTTPSPPPPITPTQHHHHQHHKAMAGMSCLRGNGQGCLLVTAPSAPPPTPSPPSLPPITPPTA